MTVTLGPGRCRSFLETQGVAIAICVAFAARGAVAIRPVALFSAVLSRGFTAADAGLLGGLNAVESVINRPVQGRLVDRSVIGRVLMSLTFVEHCVRRPALAGCHHRWGTGARRGGAPAGMSSSPPWKLVVTPMPIISPGRSRESWTEIGLDVYTTRTTGRAQTPAARPQFNQAAPDPAIAVPRTDRSLE